MSVKRILIIIFLLLFLFGCLVAMAEHSKAVSDMTIERIDRKINTYEDYIR